MKPPIATFLAPRALIRVLLLASGPTLFVLAFAWPTLALILRCVLDGHFPTEGILPSERQLLLLGQSLAFSAIAVLLCLILAIPGSAAIAQAGRTRRRPVFAAALMLLLVCPPMLYAWGWQRLLPVWIDGRVRCIGTWCLWGWPIPAILMGTGWARIGRHCYEAALLSATPWRAFITMGLPALRGHIAAGALLLFALFFGDYGVPHACGLTVYATELLGWATSSSRPIDAVWPGIPAMMVMGLCLIVAARTVHPWLESDNGESAPSQGGSTATTLAWGCFAFSWALPLAGLLRRMEYHMVSDALHVYGSDLAVSLAVAALAAIFSITLGLMAATSVRLRWMALIGSMALGVVPGAISGEAMVAAYNHAATGWVYDHWPIVMLTYVARFGWIGVVTCAVVLPRRSNLSDLAAIDGAGPLDVLWHAHLPSHWPTLVCAAWIITALCVADVAASTLVRVPSFNPIAHVLIEKFHRFEEPMLMALSLWLIAASLPAVLVVFIVFHRRHVT